jgi:small basic protein
MVASLIRSVPGIVALSVGILIGLALLGLVPQIAPYLPSELVRAPDVLIRGGDFEFWPAVAVASASTVALLAISIKRLEAREM